MPSRPTYTNVLNEPAMLVYYLPGGSSGSCEDRFGQRSRSRRFSLPFLSASSPHQIICGRSPELKTFLAERVGFEPTERFPAHSISSAANSTTLAPLPRNCRLPILSLSSRPDSNRQIGNQKSAMLWRRGWDSNPRWALTHSGFRDRCTNPLCDLSAIKVYSSSFRVPIAPRLKPKFEP